MITHSSFKPAWWLANRHLQTVWPLLARRGECKIPLKRERMELPDGDFLDLDWNTHQEGPIVIVLHGLGGSIESPYARGIMETIHKLGWRGLLMHFRGCSGQHNRLHRSYHSGETGDLAYVVEQLKLRHKDVPIISIGYSLGGNVLLKWLGETKSDNPLTTAIAISVPFELEKSAHCLNQSTARFYQWWFLRQLKESVINKFKDREEIPIDLSQVEVSDNFFHFDDHVTAPLHGFEDVHDYYQQSSSRQYLKHIQIPTLIVHSQDDPLVARDAMPNENDISDYVDLEISQAGGHVGFIAGNIPGKATYWLEDRITDYLKDVLA